MKGESGAEVLKQALEKLVESRAAIDTFYGKLGELRSINKANESLPEYNAALKRILRDHPALERVSLTDMRFANIARGSAPKTERLPIGNNLDEILGNLQEDVSLLGTQLDQTIEAFREALPIAETGGFAALVLSGRAPLPEKIMQSTDLMTVYVQFYNRACMATIAADMQIYPRGLEWLKRPTKNWSP